MHLAPRLQLLRESLGLQIRSEENGRLTRLCTSASAPGRRGSCAQSSPGPAARALSCGLALWPCVRSPPSQVWNGQQQDPRTLIDAVSASGPNLEKAWERGGGGGGCETGRGSADLAEVLHGGPQVEQHVLDRAQDLGHREAWEGSPQLRLDTFVQERALLLVGRLQQGAEGGGWGTIRARAAQGLKGLGGQQQSGKRNDKAPQMKQVHGLVTQVQGDTHKETLCNYHVLILQRQ